MVPLAANVMTACAACRAFTAWIAARSEPAPESFTFVTAMVLAGSAPSVFVGIAFTGPLEAQPDKNDALINVKAAAANTWPRSLRRFKILSSRRVDPFRCALDRLTLP